MQDLLLGFKTELFNLIISQRNATQEICDLSPVSLISLGSHESNWNDMYFLLFIRIKSGRRRLYLFLVQHLMNDLHCW